MRRPSFLLLTFFAALLWTVNRTARADPLQDAIDWGKDLIPMVREGAAALSN